MSESGLLRLVEHTRRFENGEVGLGRHVDYGLVAEVRLLTNPQILDVGRRDAAVFNPYSFGSALGAFYFGLSVQFLGFEIGLGFLDFDFAVLLGFGEFSSSSGTVIWRILLCLPFPATRRCTRA